MTIEKVYDELYGMIEDLKKLIEAGGGGDEVTITPALESGTKVADYTIGTDEGSIYAPTPDPSIGPFVDLVADHSIANGSFENTQLSYTATQDCVVLVNMANVVANTYTAIKVDAGTLWSYSGAALGIGIPVFLKAGQTIATVAAGASQYNVYSVYPLLPATAPVTETKKSRKK